MLGSSSVTSLTTFLSSVVVIWLFSTSNSFYEVKLFYWSNKAVASREATFPHAFLNLKYSSVPAAVWSSNLGDRRSSMWRHVHILLLIPVNCLLQQGVGLGSAQQGTMTEEGAISWQFYVSNQVCREQLHVPMLTLSIQDVKHEFKDTHSSIAPVVWTKLLRSFTICSPNMP